MLSSAVIDNIAKVDDRLIEQVLEPNKNEYRKYTTQELLGPKPEKDADLVDVVYQEIKKTIGESEAEYFLKDPGITFAKDKFSLVQRVMINRFFIDHLVRYRAYFEVENMSVLFNFISMEGDHITWYQRLYAMIIPWCKDHAVIKFFKDREELVKERTVEIVKEHLANKTTVEG